MPAYGVIGGQWGDEGKGKIIDYLAQDADIVARFSGGNNAGHTVLNEQGEFKLHLIPSGIFATQATCVIGNGLVLDINVLRAEVEGLEARGVDTSRLQVSDRAHIIMPYHILQDQLEEKYRGQNALGTTGRGVGPAYVDKTARSGIRVGDLLNKEELNTRLRQIVAEKNILIQRLYGGEPFSPDEILDACSEWREWLAPFIAPVESTVQTALNAGKKILLEGAQGALLDLDHGTYPYVTSSHPTIGGAAIGLGIGYRSLKGVAGVYKAYTTRVGSGPMPTELDETTGESIRDKAWEYGTTTGRARRVGWFDGIAARYSASVNEFSASILTRLDVLDGFDKVRICVGYRLDGQRINYFPSSASTLARCEPIYEDFEGWDQPTAGLTVWKKLPSKAQVYVERLQEVIGCPIAIISTGPHRHETIQIHEFIA